MATVLPTRRTQEQRTALSDQKMTEAAIALLVESGIAGATLAASGARAGYSRGLVNHRFGSKAGLLAYVHDRVCLRWIERVQHRVGDAIGIQALECVIDTLYGFIADQPDEIRAMYLLRYASIDPGAEYRANVAKVQKAQRRDVQGWIEAGRAAGEVNAGINAELAAELFCATLDGLLYCWLVDPRVPIRTLHEHLRSEVVRALAPPIQSRASPESERGRKNTGRSAPPNSEGPGL